MRLLFERTKTVTEPSGASAFAALLAGKVDAAGLRVGVTLSGGNVTAARFAELVGMTRGAVARASARVGAGALTLAALALVLASAALHAGWNALVADARDTHATTAVALLVGAAVFAHPGRADLARRGRGVAVHRRVGGARARVLRAARRGLHAGGPARSRTRSRAARRPCSCC